VLWDLGTKQATKRFCVEGNSRGSCARDSCASGQPERRRPVSF
jgi:hypothetical protein